jgi:hypothetical protein
VIDVDALTPAGRAALAACRDSLDPDALRRNAALVEGYVTAAEILERLVERHRRMRHPLLTTGQRGSPIAHPLLSEIRRQSSHVAELARVLGLTPKAGRGANARAPDVLAGRKLRRLK